MTPGTLPAATSALKNSVSVSSPALEKPSCSGWLWPMLSARTGPASSSADKAEAIASECNERIKRPPLIFPDPGSGLERRVAADCDGARTSPRTPLRLLHERVIDHAFQHRLDALGVSRCLHHQDREHVFLAI